jgi:hypothetical protein
MAGLVAAHCAANIAVKAVTIRPLLQVETDFPADTTAQNVKIHKRHRDGMRSNADVTATAELREPVAPKRLEEPEPAEPEPEDYREPKESQRWQETNSPTRPRRRGLDRR